MTAPVFVLEPDELAHASVGGLVRVAGPEGRHAVAVRRLGVGERVDIVDGLGRRVDGEVVRVLDKQSLEVRVDAVTDLADPEPWVVVVQALPKGERGELAVELLTEVGVDEIVPWDAARCVTRWRGERADKARRRWVDAARAAGKQSRRARFPDIADLATTADVGARIAAAAVAIVLHEEARTPIAAVAPPTTGEVVVVVGPEGGLTADEVAEFESAGARTVRLGPTVLRTSSAGIAAVAALLSASDRWAAGSVEG